MIDKIDSVILGLFTRISHRFQELTGRTNFFLAKVLLIMASFQPFFGFVNYWVPILPRKSHPLDLFCLVIVFDLFRQASACGKAEKSVQEGERALPSLALFISNGKIRCILFLALLTIIAWVIIFPPKSATIPSQIIDNCFGLSLAMVIYLLAVTPRPPGTSKIREWLNGFLSRFRKPAFATNES